MSQASTRITSVNHAAQGDAGDQSEALYDVRRDLEDQQADLCSHASLLNFLGDCQGTDPGEQTMASAFYALANGAEAIRGGLEDIVERLMTLERAGEASPATDELEAMAPRAWKERGIVILWPERISNDRHRSNVLNAATSLYGPRAGGKAVVS